MKIFRNSQNWLTKYLCIIIISDFISDIYSGLSVNSINLASGCEFKRKTVEFRETNSQLLSTNKVWKTPGRRRNEKSTKNNNKREINTWLMSRI